MATDPIIILTPKPHPNSQVSQTQLGWTVQQPDGSAAGCGWESFGAASEWLAEALKED
jgi:hypothetical protein